MNLNETLMVIDCDGVALNWEFAYDSWMERHGFVMVDHTAYRLEDRYELSEAEADRYVAMFNETAAMGFLGPHKDAYKYIRKLHEEHGIIFDVVTKCGTNRYTKKLRSTNLENVFGNTVFRDIVCIDYYDSKYKYLERYRDSGCVWVEDNAKNAEIGNSLGMNTFFMDNGYNDKPKDSNIKIVNSWKQIYDYLML